MKVRLKGKNKDWLFDGVTYFDKDLFYELALQYRDNKNDNDTLNELLRHAAVLVQIVLKSDIGISLGILNCEMLMTDALEHIFVVLKYKNIPHDGPTNFMNYLWHCARNIMILSIKTYIYKQEFDSDERRYPAMGRVYDHIDVDVMMYLDSFVDIVSSMVPHDIRFVGRDRDTCVFMAECILGKRKNVSPMAAQYRFGISRGHTNFLLGYTRFLIQKTIDEVRRVDDSI